MTLNPTTPNAVSQAKSECDSKRQAVRAALDKHFIALNAYARASAKDRKDAQAAEEAALKEVERTGREYEAAHQAYYAALVQEMVQP